MPQRYRYNNYYNNDNNNSNHNDQDNNNRNNNRDNNSRDDNVDYRGNNQENNGNNRDDDQNRNNHNPSGNQWTSDPKLKNIDPAKMQMLLSMASQANGKSPNDMLPMLMAAASQSKSSGMSFSSNEIDTIIEVLKVGRFSAEIAKMEQILSMMKLMK